VIGDAQLEQGEFAAARASLRSAIAADPLNESLWIDLARASSGSAQRTALAEAHRLNPLDKTVAVMRKQLHGRPAFSGGRS
jgi:Flp pilus assembly protein TadD